MTSQANSTQPVADASSGFHDIKTLPEFSPVSSFWLSPLFLALLYFAFRRWNKRDGKKSAPPPPPRDPTEVALEELVRLELDKSAGKVSVRQFAVRLSFIFRNYFQATLSFDATEQTARELSVSLPKALLQHCSQLPDLERSEFISSALGALRFCERAAFSDRSEVLFTMGSAEVERHFAAVRSGIQTLAQWFSEIRLLQERKAQEAASKREAANLP